MQALSELSSRGFVIVASNRGHTGMLFCDAEACEAEFEDQGLAVDAAHARWRLLDPKVPCCACPLLSRRRSDSEAIDPCSQARSLAGEAPFTYINWSVPVSIVGHSMGGSTPSFRSHHVDAQH